MWLILLLIGALASGAFGLLGYRLRALSGSGLIAAIAVGTALFACATPAWYGQLIVFFLTSTFWSAYRKQIKRGIETHYAKGSRRDAGQVLANGGLAAMLGIASLIWPSNGWWFVFVGVMASVTADTWATEIGGLARRDPRSIVTWRRVPRGTSGGVSSLGSLAAAGGALTIGIAAIVLTAVQIPAYEWLFDMTSIEWHVQPLGLTSGGLLVAIAALVGGVAGAFADSFIGATVQRMNRCNVCGAEVERSAHCGQPAAHLRGWRWMNNDAVNMISSAIGGSVAWLLWLLVA